MDLNKRWLAKACFIKDCSDMTQVMLSHHYAAPKWPEKNLFVKDFLAELSKETFLHK